MDVNMHTSSEGQRVDAVIIGPRNVVFLIWGQRLSVRALTRPTFYASRRRTSAPVDEPPPLLQSRAYQILVDDENFRA